MGPDDFVCLEGDLDESRGCLASSSCGYPLVGEAEEKEEIVL